MEVIIQPDVRTAAELVAQIVARGLRENPRLVLGLTAGRGMECVYARLVKMHREEGLDFSACHIFNLDEFVGLPPKHAASHRYYMNRHLFLRVNIDLQNVHLPDAMATDLASECENYERLIAKCGGIDLLLLGIGQNGYLGFNEPPSDLLSHTQVQTISPLTRQQIAPFFRSPDQVPHRAITMGVGSVLDCRQCVLLAAGEEKAMIIDKVVEGPITSMISATMLQLHSDCKVILDQAAASKLKCWMQPAPCQTIGV